MVANQRACAHVMSQPERAIFFGEPLTWGKAFGVALIVAGVAVSSQG